MVVVSVSKMAALDKDQTEKFIQLVSNCPAIYDSRLEEHRDLQLIQNIWMSVQKAMQI